MSKDEVRDKHDAPTLDVGAATRGLRAVPAGKVIDFISGRYLKDSPEEYVRQNVAMSLVLEYGYSRSQIEIEHPIKVGSSKRRVDIAIFPPDAPHDQESIWVLIECKKAGTKREAKKDGVDQLKSYMAACLGCEHGMWTNGEDRVCYTKSGDKGLLTFVDAIDVPGPGSDAASAPAREDLRPATGDNLLFAFRRCHNYIAGNQGLQKPDAFWELLKVIFCKIEDERSEAKSLKFYVSQTERSSMDLQARVKARLSGVFSRVAKKYRTIFKSSEKIELKSSVLTYLVGELQNYSLLESSVDVKGVAYEEIVGSNLRGDRGEFFTPRNACRMAVQMLGPRPGDRVLDPACGTGGFLIIAMNHVLGQIEARHRRRWKKSGPTSAQLLEFHRARQEHLSQCVVGLDLNPNLVRAAKMNMVMNNDGSGSLAQCNSLEHPHRWTEEVRQNAALGSFDLVVTNPPFGTKIVIDDPQILRQFDFASQWEDKTLPGGDATFTQRTNSKGNAVQQSSQPPEVLFIERCLQFLRPGGRMAIVLPNGILNNPGLTYLRHSLLTKAQLLAVVDMHRDLFQPKNDTQTSVVVLRKWEDGEEASADYPIFMAIADAIGHDKRGHAIFKRRPDGRLIYEEVTHIRERRLIDGSVEHVEVTSAKPIPDDDCPGVAEAYLKWLSEQRGVSSAYGHSNPA